MGFRVRVFLGLRLQNLCGFRAWSAQERVPAFWLFGVFSRAGYSGESNGHHSGPKSANGSN